MSRSKGQKKRQRDTAPSREQKYEMTTNNQPLRLVGGAIPFQIWHQWWQAQRDSFWHFDVGRGGLGAGWPLRGVPIIPDALAPGWAGRNRPGRLVTHPVTNATHFETWDNDGYHDIMALPPLPAQIALQPVNWYRAQELQDLWEAGEVLRANAIFDAEQTAALQSANSVLEPRWRYDGMAVGVDWDMGHQWTTFRYILTNLYIGGITTGADLLAVVRDIMCDLLLLGQSGNMNGFGGVLADPAVDDCITRGSLIMLFFESENMQGGVLKPQIYFMKRALMINDLLDDTSFAGDELLHTLSDIFNAGSDDFKDFQFYRLYVSVSTGMGTLGGGNLSLMPQSLKLLRDGPHYKGRKGYICIQPKEEDGSCGLHAVLSGLSNAATRMKKASKYTSQPIPILCTQLFEFNMKIAKGNASAKKVQANMLLEMATSIGWKKGTPISPDELCVIIKCINTKYKVNFGLLIFDALNPVTKIITSYDLHRAPQEKICIVQWKYEGGGHYDCVYPTNLVTWMLRGVKNRTNLVFCYNRLKLVRNNETSDKGELCQNCNYYESEIGPDKWASEHKNASGLVMAYLACQVCGVRFHGVDCFEKHSIPSHQLGKSACESRNKCTRCGRIHRESYNCSEFFCQICKCKFPVSQKKGHVCFIQNTGPKFRTKIPNVIYSDCEGSRLTGHHTAVCVASSFKIMCETHTNFKKENKKCPTCKNGKMKSFGYFCDSCEGVTKSLECADCLQSHTNIFNGVDCISKYLEWLETLNKVTIVFHNGGRYDMHLIYLELLKKGRYYVKKEAERGTQIIFMTAGLLTEERKERKIEFRFIDSFNFIAASLRSFPTMFNIDVKLSKGRFPYELLNQANWEEYSGRCPDYPLFGVTKMEFENIGKLSKNRAKEVVSILEYIKESHEADEKWNVLEKLTGYTILDVKVLEGGCNDFRYNFWNLTGTDPFHWVTLAAAVAGTYRQEQYMPEDSIQVFGMEAREWQRKGLRGGRCEPFKLYWKAKKGDAELKIYDVNSEYPAAQIYGFAPYGKVAFDKEYKETHDFLKVCRDIKIATGKNFVDILHDPTGKLGNGIIECTVQSAYSPFPILPYKKSDKKSCKNLFMVRDGIWNGYISVLAEAIVHNQVIVVSVRRIQLWVTTSDKLFYNYLSAIYGAKVEASGWEKILGLPASEITEEMKAAFLRESKERGIPVCGDAVADNPGQRSVSKVIANCGWGYLCQKPHATDILYFDNESSEESQTMFTTLLNLDSDTDKRRMTNIPTAIGKYTRVKLTKAPMDITVKEMNGNIAYHVGGCAPAWGLQLLSRNLLALHPSQPVYCDTDSIFYIHDAELIEKGIHKSLETGLFLGEFVDEYPNHRITEFVCIGPKSYFLKCIDRKSGKTEYKGKFKGLPFLSSTYSLLENDEKLASFGMDQMKEILFSAVPTTGEDAQDSITMKFSYRNFFKRFQDMKIREVKETKTIRFTFDKRKVIWPDQEDLDEITEIGTVPFEDDEETLFKMTGEDVKAWWKTIKNKLNLFLNRG
jgi:DNA polymerase type B, organellar and viral